MKRPDTKQAEKEYLRRSGSLSWEQLKPFSPPATQTLDESLRLMHDFAVAADALDVALGHRTLDLGAGSCWSSEWLSRLNLAVVATDIAHDLLMVGKARIGSRRVGLVNADLETLPFRSGTFDRALCLNALHHIPNPACALREIARVLTPAGRLVLVEPGAGHAARETSQIAVQQFGVLEQDLEATDLMRLCTEAGFPHVALRPLSYMTGEIELTADQLSRWKRWVRTKRPQRALTKLRRVLLEFLGVGKNEELFEDALAIWLSRVLARHVSEQSVVVASKAAYRRNEPRYAAHIELESSANLNVQDGTFRARLKIRNTGSAIWPAQSSVGRVQVAIQLLDDAKRLTNRDYCRVALPQDIPPNSESVMEISVPIPPGSGAAHFRIDLVAEGITWFDVNGPLGFIVPVRLATAPRL